MYEELIRRLQDFAAGTMRDEDAQLAFKAADAIETLLAYESLYKDLCDKSQKTAEKLLDAYPKWIPVAERLPENGGYYLVYLRPFTGETDFGSVSEDWAFTTEMYFNKGQMLWDRGNESYNAVLSAVNTETEYHITHWMPLPEPPEEVDNG